MAPKQRRAGQTGGAGGQRANRRTFRAAGGSVPPRKSCALFLIIAVGVPLGVAVTIWNHLS